MTELKHYADKLIFAIALLAFAIHGYSEELPPFVTSKSWLPFPGGIGEPVQEKHLPDGSTCLAFGAEFTADESGACWEWTGALDLSMAESITFETVVENPGILDKAALYFGTSDGGWHVKYWDALSDTWSPMEFALASFASEDNAQEWSAITKIRVRLWSSLAGKAAIRMRNLRAAALDQKANLVRNGSFEISSDGIPYAWGTGHWGIRDLPWASNMNLLREHWHLDSSTAKHGKNSLCIENTTIRPILKAVSVWLKPKGVGEHQIVELEGSRDQYTLSAWLKSDHDKSPVAFGPDEKIFEIGREWKQVVVPGITWKKGMNIVIAPKAAGIIWVDAVQLQVAAKATSEFWPRIDDVSVAQAESEVDRSPPTRTPEIAAGRVVSGPTTAALAEIDSSGRFLLDSLPYIPYAISFEVIPDLNVLDFVAKSGFRDVHVQFWPDDTTEQLKAIFDRCAQLGLRIIPWIDGRTSQDRFTKHIEDLKEHPALLVWMVFDEPNTPEQFAEAARRVKLAKELDPAHPAYVNYLAEHLVNQAGDIYSMDLYPIPHGKPIQVVDSVAAMKADAAKVNKPVWTWLQGTGFAYSHAREPSPRELSCMAYGSLIGGARGISYFAHIPQSPACFEEMRALAVEIDALTPALYSPEPAPDTQCDQKQILHKAFAHAGKVWVLAVNSTSSNCEAGFTVANTKGEAEVLFEGRQIKVQSGNWRDSFGPYERHVYKLDFNQNDT